MLQTVIFPLPAGRSNFNFIPGRLGQLFFVDVLKRLDGFLFRSPAGDAPRLTERAHCQRQRPICPDRRGSGRYNNQCALVRWASLCSSPAQVRFATSKPAILRCLRSRCDAALHSLLTCPVSINISETQVLRHHNQTTKSAPRRARYAFPSMSGFDVA